MKQFEALICVGLFAALIFCQVTSQTQAMLSANSPDNVTNTTLPFLHTEGDRIVNESGKEVPLRGVNIGNWLLVEPWIMGKDWQNKFETEWDIWNSENLSDNNKPNLTLIHTFRGNWFTKSDIQNIADAGMNCIRLPIWWRATNETDDYDGSFKYVNQCIEWCKEYKIYVILDLHGAPGGQNNVNTNLGERRDPQNDLWNSTDSQEQFIKWWERVADLYKNESTVAGYDLLNEGDPEVFNDMIELYNKTYYAIRKNDTNHIIILEAGIQSHNLYQMPLPEERGWANVVYSFNYYPWGSDNGTKALNVTFPCLRRRAVDLGVPIYVGEFNVMERNASPLKNYTDIFKNYTDTFDSYGWSWTFWTYKKIETGKNFTWGLYGYVGADKGTIPDFNNITSVEAAFRKMNTSYIPKQNNTTNNLSAVLKLNRSGVLELNLSKVVLPDRCGIDLDPCNFCEIQPNDSIDPEWYGDLPSFGSWKSSGEVNWTVQLNESDNYSISVDYATPHNNTTFVVQIDNKDAPIALNRILSRTGECCDWNNPSGCDWQSFKEEDLGRAYLSEGKHNISVIWKTNVSESIIEKNNIYAGNLHNALFINQSCEGD